MDDLIDVFGYLCEYSDNGWPIVYITDTGDYICSICADNYNITRIVEAVTCNSFICDFCGTLVI
jgi:hypothetical protein